MALAGEPLVGCGSPSHPPALGGGTLSAGSMPGGGVGAGGAGGEADGGPSLIDDAASIVPMCSLGPQGGVCACVDQPLLGDPPNFFFVLDRSGSMAAPWSGSTGDTKWVTVVKELGQLIVSLGPRASYAAALFPNPFVSPASCGAGDVVFPLSGTGVLRGDAPAGTPGPNESLLYNTLAAYVPIGGTPTAATLSALAPKIESLPGKTFVILATDGGPNCSLTPTCSVDQCTANIENDLGCPPGGPPNCCADPAAVGTSSCLDSQATIAAVQALARAGVPVYVVGVPQSEPYAALLDELAQAGDTARGTEPQYYAASSTDPGELRTALSKIAAKITGTCTLTLGSAPPDPSLVNVFFDGKPLAQKGPDGWSLAGTAVTILGASCQSILDGDVLDVRVVAGCPTVTQ